MKEYYDQNRKFSVLWEELFEIQGLEGEELLKEILSVNMEFKELFFFRQSLELAM